MAELGLRVEPGSSGDPARRAAWRQIAAHEESLSEALLSYLGDQKCVQIVGQPEADQEVRVPTISFVHDQLRSSEIVTAVDAHGIGIRHGHFYAPRLIDDLGLGNRDGVVRVSMVHYNTLEEVQELISVLERVLGP